MTKNEIIQAVILATVPQGAQIVEHEVYGDMTVTHIGPGAGGGALAIVAAQLFIAQVTEDTVDFPDEPNPALLRRIHESLRDFHVQMVVNASFDAMEEEHKKSHRTMIAKLQVIASQLGVTYEAPEDTLLA